MGIVVLPYDPEWPAKAAAELEAVADALSGAIDAIEHIGSTAVPGLAAKAIVDLMAASPDFAAVRSRADRLAAIGYIGADNGMPGRLLFHKTEGGMPVNLHVVPTATWETRNQRLLRDYLRANPKDARRYGDLKLALARETADGDDYSRKKTALIQELMDRARAERGLPPVDVWED